MRLLRMRLLRMRLLRMRLLRMRLLDDVDMTNNRGKIMLPAPALAATGTDHGR
jgi:hypothetical protein